FILHRTLSANDTSATPFRDARTNDDFSSHAIHGRAISIEKNRRRRSRAALMIGVCRVRVHRVSKRGIRHSRNRTRYLDQNLSAASNEGRDTLSSSQLAGVSDSPWSLRRSARVQVPRQLSIAATEGLVSLVAHPRCRRTKYPMDNFLTRRGILVLFVLF